MPKISDDARRYCPNYRNPAEGLRLKDNGVYERAEVIGGTRKSFSSKDPVEVWKKRSEYIALAEDETEEQQKMEVAGPLFETVAEKYKENLMERKAGTRRVYLPALERALKCFNGRRVKRVSSHGR